MAQVEVSGTTDQVGSPNADVAAARVTPYEPGYAYPNESPLRLDVDYQTRYSQRLAPVKLLLVAPHYVAALLIELMLVAVTLCAAVAVLVTGRYPRRLFDAFVGGARWLVRVAAYGYLLTDSYPPFSFREEPRGPVRANLDYPPGGRIARWRPLAAWILVLPQFVALAFRYLALYFLLLGGFWSIVFAGQLPRPVFDFAVQTLRIHCRLTAYAGFLTERRPGFQF